MSQPTHASHLPRHRSLYVLRDVRVRVGRTAEAVVHPHSTLALLTNGEAVIWCGAPFRLEPGDLLAIPEGQPHYVESSSEAQAQVLSFCGSCMASEAGQALVCACQLPADGMGKLRTLSEEAIAGFLSHLDALEAELTCSGPYVQLAVEGHLALLAALVFRATTRTVQPPATSGSLAAEALAVIHARASEGISLEDVAAAVHRTPTHTAAMVKRHTGRTVVEWITHSRMAAARQLLVKTDESIELIAARVGFASPSHFHRVFKRLHGSTPAAWRRTHPLE